ncbi:conserved hypothetical protein [Alteromonas infernus]
METVYIITSISLFVVACVTFTAHLSYREFEVSRKGKAKNSLFIKRANYISGYTIEIYFSDGTVKRVDFERFLKSAKHPVTRSYLDLKKFQQFRVIEGELDWNDLDLCIPLHQLYSGKVKHKE